MKKNILKVISILFTFFLFILKVDAGSYTAVVGSEYLIKGGSTKLTITLNDGAGRFNISSSNPGVISISEDRAWLDNSSYSITLNALSVGSSTITITPTNVSGYDEQKITGAKTITVYVSLPREKSTDNNLKNLSVEGFEIKPAFDPNVTKYSVEVPEGTKSVNIIPTQNDGYATVIGGGVKEVTEGVNNVSIVVRAENGAEKVYDLTINVIDKNPIEVEVLNKKYSIVKLKENFTCLDNFEESTIVINNTTIPSCKNGKIGYTLVGLKDEEGIISPYIYSENSYTKYNEAGSKNLKIVILNYDKEDSGFTRTKVNIDNVSYDGFNYGESNRFYLVYGNNVETGEKGFYLYDSVNKTFSLFEKAILNELQNENKTYLYITIIFGAGLFLAIIGLIAMASSGSKNTKSKNKEIINEEEVNDNELEETSKDEEIVEENNQIEENINENEIYDIFEDDKKRKKKNRN